MGDIIKKLNDMDRVLPEVKVYQFIVLMLLVFNLGGLGMLLYNQYTSQYIPSPVILTQKGGNASYDMCVTYYQNQCERYKVSTEEESETSEVADEEVEATGYIDEARAIRFALTADPATGVLADPVVTEDSETGGFTLTFDGGACELGAMLLYAENNGELSEWIEINYPDLEATMLDYQVLDDNAYMLVDEDGYTHYLYMVNSEVADLWALPVEADSCGEDPTDLTASLEAMLMSLEYMVDDSEELGS